MGVNVADPLQVAFPWKGLCIACLVVIALFVAFAGLMVYWSLPGTSVGDVQRLVEKHVRRGDTQEEVIAFLDTQDIEHTVRTFAANGFSDTEWFGSGPDVTILPAIIRDTDNQPIGEADINIYFIFDASGHLQSYVIKESYISL